MWFATLESDLATVHSTVFQARKPTPERSGFASPRWKVNARAFTESFSTREIVSGVIRIWFDTLAERDLSTLVLR